MRAGRRVTTIGNFRRRTRLSPTVAARRVPPDPPVARRPRASCRAPRDPLAREAALRHARARVLRRPGRPASDDRSVGSAADEASARRSSWRGPRRRGRLRDPLHAPLGQLAAHRRSSPRPAGSGRPAEVLNPAFMPAIGRGPAAPATAEDYLGPAAPGPQPGRRHGLRGYGRATSSPPSARRRASPRAVRPDAPRLAPARGHRGPGRVDLAHGADPASTMPAGTSPPEALARGRGRLRLPPARHRHPPRPAAPARGRHRAVPRATSAAAPCGSATSAAWPARRATWRPGSRARWAWTLPGGPRLRPSPTPGSAPTRTSPSPAASARSTGTSWPAWSARARP